MKDILYADDVKKAVNKNHISYWEFSKCSLGGVGYGFYFNDDQVIFDGSCGCCSLNDERLTNYQEIADIYNRNKDIDFRERFINFFEIS